MKTFVCKKCGHIEFGAAPDNCPVCWEPKTSFTDDPTAIKKPANPAALTDGDKKHIPQIVVVKTCGLIPGGGCTDVHVKVGEIEHVMEEKHSIRWIDAYIDFKFIARIELTVPSCHPAGGLHLKANSGKFQAIENCNVHGNWMSEKAL
jgi:desulfoferrodoxin-like iron-binding protein